MHKNFVRNFMQNVKYLCILSKISEFIGVIFVFLSKTKDILRKMNLIKSKKLRFVSKYLFEFFS